MGKINRISTSAEELELLLNSGKKERVLVAKFPTDKPDCECQPVLKKLRVDLSRMSTKKAEAKMAELGDRFTCPRSKEGAIQYQIICNNCGEVVAECYSTDAKLKDYFDLHYISRSELVEEVSEVEYVDKKGKTKIKKEKQTVGYWQGCMVLNISPNDLAIGVECACGADSRDFRGNLTMPAKRVASLVNKTMRGRNFGLQNSQYRVSKVLTKPSK